MDDDFAIGAGLEDGAGLFVFVSELSCVDEISVVSNGEETVEVFDDEGLDVLDASRAGG